MEKVNITSTIKRPLEATRADGSVRVGLQESTPEQPAFFLRTPERYVNLRLGADAYQSEELGDILKPLGQLTSLLAKELFPRSEGVLSGIGYGFRIHQELSGFEKEMNFVNGLAVMKPMVKMLKLGKDVIPGWANSTLEFLDVGLTVIAAFKTERGPKDDLVKTAFLANLAGTPLAPYVSPTFSLVEVLNNELKAMPCALGGSPLDVEAISKRLLKIHEAPSTAQSILDV